MSENSVQYQCKTQYGNMPTFGVAPVRHIDPKHHGDSLVLGLHDIIPRWDVEQPNRKLQYFVQKDTFPSADLAQSGGSTLQQAADEWNSLNLGITITSTNDQAGANFYLVYVVPTAPEDQNDLAVAFFPNEVNKDIQVCKKAFTADYKPILKNIFLHELGHVLGLRHEFAITGDLIKKLKVEGDGAKQFMKPNYNSIMSYNFPPTMQDTDKEGIKAFYKLDNGYKIDGTPVTDYVPQIRKMT